MPSFLGTNKISPKPLSKSAIRKMSRANDVPWDENSGEKPQIKCKCTECGPTMHVCTSAEGCFVGQTYDFKSRRVVETTFGCLHDKVMEHNVYHNIL